MTDPIWTIVLMLTAGAILIAWDVYVAFFNSVSNRKDTISGITMAWSRKFWVLPYTFGVLGGHLFFPALGGELRSSVWSALILIGTGVVVSGMGFLVRKFEMESEWPWHSVVLVLMGLVMGYLFWPQMGG